MSIKYVRNKKRIKICSLNGRSIERSMSECLMNFYAADLHEIGNEFEACLVGLSGSSIFDLFRQWHPCSPHFWSTKLKLKDKKIYIRNLSYWTVV